MSDPLNALAIRAGRALERKGWRLATAESCTGGWIAKTLTDIPGSSAWLERGWVSYSNDAKQDMLNVSSDTLIRFGAVSAETVTEMARGALANSRAQVAVAVSGVAGPDGGSSDKPVGTVWIGWATAQTATSRHYRFDGDREAVRRQTVATVLGDLPDVIATKNG